MAAQNRERDYSTKQKEAKDYAIEKGKIVYLYRDPVLGLAFMEQAAADALGIFPVERLLPY